MSARAQVLIVDDEPRNLRILEEILAEEVDLHSAANGEMALAMLEGLTPDLVILDLMMPGLDGYEVCQKIRANPRLGLTRIILVSGKAMIEERLRGYACGADDYITKPFVPEELFAKTKVFLKLTATERALSEVNADLENRVRLRTEQLLKVEKDAYVGAHAAEILHNLKNPLGVLSMIVSLLEEKYPEEEMLKRANNAHQRMDELIRTILNSGRQSRDCDLKKIDLNEILKTELKLLDASREFRLKGKVTLDLQDLPPFEGLPSHFSQSFSNLLRNAIDSMHGREQQHLRVGTATRGGAAVVEISDTGCGIPRDALERVFDPFYTTKPIVSKGDEPTGTGLGLASVKRLLESNGCRIEIESVVNEGTLVRVTVPTAKVG